MASFGDHRLFFFFFLVLLFLASPTQARESKFFSKFTHIDTQNKFESESIVPSPTLAPAPAPETVSEESERSHYGPFGPGSGLVVPKETTTSGSNTNPFSTTDENEPLKEQLYSATPESTGYQPSNYKNSGYGTNYYNNGYETAGRQGMSDTRFMEGGKYYHDVKNENSNYNEYESGKVSPQNQANGYSGSSDGNGYSLASSSYGAGSQNTENGYTNSYNNNVYGNERQGMSDTRFVEGGKNYYDVKNENYYHPANRYESGTQDQGYNGDAEGTNEINNTDKFENQEEFEEGQEESLP